MQEVTKDQDGRFTEIALADGQQIYEKAILATYMSAAQFPMDMKYFFKPFYSEEELTIYVEHDEDPPSIKIPADLLEDPNDLSEDETMVGPNPKVEGWTYVLSYENGKVKEVLPVPGQTYNEEGE